MRFEAKHRFAKAVAINSSNFKNTPKSVFHRYQIQLATTLSIQTFDQNFELIIHKGEEMPFPEHFVGRFTEDSNSLKCSKISFNSVLIEPGTCLMKSWSEDGPKLYEVKEVWVINKIPFAKVAKLHWEYDDHLKFYTITKCSNKSLYIEIERLDVTSAMIKHEILKDERERHVIIIPFEIILP